MGQNTFSSYYQQMIGNLGALSGATTQTPSGAANAQTQSAQMAYNAQNQNAQSGLGLVGMALGGASAAGLFSGFGGGGGGMQSPYDSNSLSNPFAQTDLYGAN